MRGSLRNNSVAAVGDGTVSIESAGDVPLGGRAVAVAAGNAHTRAVLTTSAVRCWGDGGSGRLHDMGDPVAPAGHIRDRLGDDGTWLIVEQAGFASFGRVAETPFNLLYEVRH